MASIAVKYARKYIVCLVLSGYLALFGVLCFLTMLYTCHGLMLEIFRKLQTKLTLEKTSEYSIVM